MYFDKNMKKNSDFSTQCYFNEGLSIDKAPILYLNKDECCGCFTCYSLCADNGNKAITMIRDSEGFFYPTVDLSKCVGCKQCVKVCPLKNK